MKIPTALIQNFITSEFTAKLNSSGEYIICSPFVDDKKGKLYLNSKNGTWIDFKGGESGSFLKFVKEYFGFKTFEETVKYLVENYNLIAEKKTEETKEDINNKNLLKEFIKDAQPKLFENGNNLGLFGKQAYNYVLNRKLDESYYPKLGYCFNPNSQFHQRIFIPFFENGKIVYGITRSIEKNSKLRYLNIKKLNSKDYVFNIDNVDDSCVICEGCFDVMSLVVDMGAISMLSADIGSKQMEKIFDKEVKTIIVVPDKDATGKAKLDRNIKKLLTYCPYSGLKIYVYNIPEADCKDLNDLKIKTGKDYILKKECTRYGESLFERSYW